MKFPIHAIMDEIDADPRRALALAQELGIEKLGLRMFPSGRYPVISPEDTQWVKDRYENNDIQYDVVTPGINKDIFNADTIDRMVDEELPLSIEAAKTIGVREISLFSWAKTQNAALPVRFGGLSPSLPAGLIDAFGRLTERAARDDMYVSIEVGWQCWGDSGLGVGEIIRQVGHDRLRLLWDPCNALRGRLWWSQFFPDMEPLGDPTQTLLDELDAVADLIVGVHVRDCTLETATTEYVNLGEGVVNWKALLRRLWDRGYRGPLTIEHHLPTKNPATRHAAGYLKQLMDG